MKYRLIEGNALDVLKKLKSESIDCCVTSPPYWKQRDYHVPDQLGQEKNPMDYVKNLVQIFDEMKRVLKPTGTFWLNINDTFQDKSLLGIPWKVAFALKDKGWIIRSDNIWHKLNAMPDGVVDRPTRDHEYMFFFTQSPEYFYDQDSVREPHHTSNDRRLKFGATKGKGKTEQRKYSMKICGAYHPEGRNLRTVWSLTSEPNKENHFAPFPKKLVLPCIKAGCPINGYVLDPFCGSGTTGIVAIQNSRNFIGIELNPEYHAIAKRRLGKVQPSLFETSHTTDYESKPEVKIITKGTKFTLSKE